MTSFVDDARGDGRRVAQENTRQDAQEISAGRAESAPAGGRADRGRRVRTSGRRLLLLLAIVVVGGAIFWARSALRPSSNPFAAWRLAIGQQREELLGICGTPDSRHDALDGVYEQWTYRRGEHSIELVFFQRRLESWREIGPVVQRGGQPSGPCCR